MRTDSGRVAARVRDLLNERAGLPSDARADDDAGGEAVPALRSPTLRQRVAGVLPVRLDPGRRAALAVGAAVLVAAVATGVWLIAERPHAVAVSSGDPAPAATADLLSSGPATVVGPSQAAVVPSSASPSTAEVVVDVAGRVRHPGLYRLPPGSRVDDAVQAAGGALPGTNLTSLNLAAKVGDGQQVVVGVTGAVGAGAAGQPGPGAGTSAPGAAAGPVNINSATLEQLESLPGVGPVLAQHILDWRAAHGGFKSVDQLNDVPGIGDVKFADLKSVVSV